jgi:hypothetical protein
MTKAQETVTAFNASDLVRKCERTNNVRRWLSPCCAYPVLPPAVMPSQQRHCAKCGRYFNPSETHDAR